MTRYFTEVGYSTVETVLPPVVSFLAQQRKAIGNVLRKAVRSTAKEPTASQTIAWSEFQHLLQVGQGEQESGLPLDDGFWSSARALADPHNTGQVEYKPLLNRCHFRYVKLLSSFLIQKHTAFSRVILFAESVERDECCVAQNLLTS